MLQENCYVVSDESRECVIIDCGAFFPEEKKEILQYIHDNNLIPKHLLATHGHLDHNFGNRFIFDDKKAGAVPKHETVPAKVSDRLFVCALQLLLCPAVLRSDVGDHFGDLPGAGAHGIIPAAAAPGIYDLINRVHE